MNEINKTNKTGLQTDTTRVQTKEDESDSGFPSDEWLDSSKVHASKKKHLELLGLLSNKSDKMLVLDAGCGPGTYGMILAEYGFNVIGIDIAEAAINKGNERAAHQNISFHAEKGDLEHLRFPDNTFDIVFTGWTLHHFPSLDQVCSELCRVLKPGGRIAVVEPNEANFMARVSRLVEDILRPIVLKVGWDSPNRTVHYYKEYLLVFEKNNIMNLKYYSCYASLPPIWYPRNSISKVLLKMIYLIRSLLFSLSTKVLPRPLNGQDLLITGNKKTTT
jgi:ubiquinone/menaquinone biosynthesis C-methylase UbiE